LRGNRSQRSSGNPPELDPRESGRRSVVARRECESYAKECAALAAQAESAELRQLLLCAARSWCWLAGAKHP